MRDRHIHLVPPPPPPAWTAPPPRCTSGPCRQGRAPCRTPVACRLISTKPGRPPEPRVMPDRPRRAWLILLGLAVFWGGIGVAYWWQR